MRSIAVFVGVVTLIVGVVGLFAPVSIEPELQTVRCGTAISPDLSEARTQRDRASADVPPAEEAVTFIDFEELCRMELEDRRILAITVAAGGAFILAVGAGVGLLSRARDDANSDH